MSEFSSESSIQAATKPDQIAPTTQTNVNSDLELSWVAPNERGSSITSYNIFIMDST